MQKQKLLNAISRYNIGPKSDNSPNATKWSVSEGNLTIHHLSQDKSCRIITTVSGVELEDGAFGIYDPDKYAKILSALDSDIELEYHSKHGRQMAMYIKDNQITVDYILSPLDAIFNDQNKDPETERPLKAVPAPNVEFILTREFCEKFIKSKNALPDASTFAVSAGKMGDSQDVEFIINHSNHPTNQIKMHIYTDITVNSDLELVAFNADYLKEIFLANKDFNTASITIFSKVISDPERGNRLAAGMDIDFQGDDYSSKYRLSKVEIV